MSNRLADYDNWGWDEYVEAVVCDFIAMTDRPLKPTPHIEGAMTALYYAGSCPFCAARSIALGMGINEVRDIPHPGVPGEDTDGSMIDLSE